MKKQPIYALIQTKDDGFEYEVGEIIEVSIWKKNLLMIKGKNRKIVKLMDYKVK